MTKDLHARRVEASAASLGQSGDPIYSMVERAISTYQLAGVVLDFGAGTGTLSRRLHQLGCFRQVVAADLMPRPEQLPAEIDWIQADLNDALAVAPGSFDVIVSAEVIEHLENPRAIAREWFRLLRPGGTVLVTTPNNESWRALVALLIRGHFVAFGDGDYPAHITALVRKDLQRILLEAGFSQPAFMFSDVGGIPKIPRIHWGTISAGRLRGLRYSDNVLAIARRPI